MQSKNDETNKAGVMHVGGLDSKEINTQKLFFVIVFRSLKQNKNILFSRRK